MRRQVIFLAASLVDPGNCARNCDKPHRRARTPTDVRRCKSFKNHNG